MQMRRTGTLGPERMRAHHPVHPRLVLGILAILLSFVTSTTYAADLNGTWNASSLRVSWSIGDWGKSCGPRPSGGGERGGTVTLTQTGSDFKLSGLGRSYSSNQCWEQMPGLSSRGHSAGSSAIQTTCKMPAGDPRQATVITTWYPRGDKLYFDETGQYQFVLKGSNCTASVRRTRVLSRVVEKEAPDPLSETDAEKKEPDPPTKSALTTTKKETPSAAPPPPPARASHCENAGKAVSLEVTPKTKLMRVGESFEFQAIARDKKGCRAAVDTKWSLTSGQGGMLTPDGKLSVSKEAPNGTLTLKAEVDDKSVIVTARIVTDEEFERLIAGGEYGVMGESLDAASIELSTTHVEFDSETESGDENRRPLLLGLVFGLLVLAGAAAFLVLRRGKSSGPSPVDNEVPDEVPPLEAPTQAAPAPVVEPPKPVRLCPVCGKRYDDGTMFCGEDGARLVRAN